MRGGELQLGRRPGGLLDEPFDGRSAQDVEDVLTILPEVVHKLRAMSPLYQESRA